MSVALPRHASQSASGTYIDDDVDMETTCPGQRFTRREELKIRRMWLNNYIKLCGEHSERWNKILENESDENSSSLPPAPLKVLPETTKLCIERGYCYHREYMTNETSETSRALGACEPRLMLQVLSLRLSHTESCPIRVYGTFAVRDDWEPLRNYIFKRTRDNPVVIDKDSFDLTLCSPCRGMYVKNHALLDVDLWIKNEGDRSTDEQLLSVYVEIELRSGFNEKSSGRINGDRCMLDMDYIFLTGSVTAIIQVSSLADSPNHVRFTALNSSFDDEIMLYEGKGIMKGELIQHVVAVKEEEKLRVRLELGNSVFEWTFQDGITSSPGDLIENQFQVKIFFSPNDLEPVRTRYFDWQRRCQEYKRKLSYAG